MAKRERESRLKPTVRFVCYEPTCERWVAVRPFLSTDAPLGARVVPSGREYLDLSTLSLDADGARRLAMRRDEQNRKAIREGDALEHTRVVRVRVEEVR